MAEKIHTQDATYKQEDFDSIKPYLPSNYIKLIREKINNKVSERMIQYVLAGKCADAHNIVPIAIKMALKQKKRQEAIKSQINQI